MRMIRFELSTTEEQILINADYIIAVFPCEGLGGVGIECVHGSDEPGAWRVKGTFNEVVEKILGTEAH